MPPVDGEHIHMTTEAPLQFMARGTSNPAQVFAGTRYAAEKFGVTVQAINARLTRGTFPVQPCGQTVAGHVLWRREEIDRAAELLKTKEA